MIDPVIKNDTISHDGFNEEFVKNTLPHKGSLYSLALRMTADPDEADDLVQDTYYKAYRFYDKFEKGTNIRAWLYRIMKNSFINLYRKNTREPDKVDYDDVENFYENIKSEATNSNDLEKDIFDNIFDDEITVALNNLSEEFRTIILLCDIEGFTYDEVAEFLDCPVGTVRSRLHRARNLLAEKLQNYASKRGLI